MRSERCVGGWVGSGAPGALSFVFWLHESARIVIAMSARRVFI